MPSEDVYAVSADAADDAATGGNVAAERAPPLMSTDVFEQEPGNQIDNIVPTRGYGLTPTVGLGGSAGSIPALCTFFEAMPADSGLVFVVVLHLAPEHESTLAELLGRHTAMPVVQAEDGMSVEADHVYVIPPGKYLASVDGHLKLTPLEPERGRRMTVDVFFRTLADTHGAHAAAIVLSGADGDGAIGLKRIKERGGLTVAQDPNEAEHDGMPRSAIATNMVDWVFKAHELPARLLEYFAREKQVKLPPEDGPQPTTAPSASPGAEEASLREVLAFLRTRTDRDFSYYKRATVLRRISRRMQINGMAGLPEYLIFLRTHPGESGALLQDMLISVTNFFRDRKAFTALETYVPLLFRGKKSGDTVRVWVTACAWGEEAYSVAMLLSEHARRLSAPPNVQVFATDLAEEAVQSARNGVYPTNIATDMSEERLARFFTKEHLGYRVRRELRETVLFAQHDLLKDSPFSKLDLVTCRNLLIYLNRDAQERALAIFHFALLRQGMLFLGTSESVDETSEFFAPLDKKYRLYAARPAVKMGLPVPVGIGTLTRTIQDRGHAADGPVLPVATRPVAPPTGMPPWPQAERATGQAAASEAYLRILAEGGPASMIVSGQHDILHLSGAAGRFLQFGVGELTRDLWQAVHPMLRIELRAALTRASRTGQAARASGLSIELDGERQAVDIQVSPVWEDAASYFVITFGLRPAEPMDAVPAIPEIDPLAHQLEKELDQLKRHLRDVQESHEVTIEEHKAGNEELQAINEELRSASEELETSREELQAINEELNTVNAELKAHVDELAHANGDLHNLMAATNIATVFLDRELRITRYTPCAVTLFNFIPTDVGRPLTDLQHRLDYAELEEDARQVLARLAPVEREVHKHGNGWFLARLQPYRTVDDYIAGVVFTFVDITERRRADEALRESEERQVFLLGLSDALRSLDDPLNIQQVAMRMLGQRLDATRAFYFFTEPAEGGDWIHTIETDYRRDPGMPSHAGRHSVRDFGLGLFEGAEYGKVVAVEDVTRVSLLTASEVRKYLALEVVAFINVPLIRNGKFVAGIGAHDLAPRLWKPEEIALIQEVAARVGAAVERTRAEAAMRESEERLQTMAENLPGGAVFIVNRDLRYLLANGEALRGAGLKPEDLVVRRSLTRCPRNSPQTTSLTSGVPWLGNISRANIIRMATPSSRAARRCAGPMASPTRCSPFPTTSPSASAPRRPCARRRRGWPPTWLTRSSSSGSAARSSRRTTSTRSTSKSWTPRAPSCARTPPACKSWLLAGPTCCCSPTGGSRPPRPGIGKRCSWTTPRPAGRRCR